MTHGRQRPPANDEEVYRSRDGDSQWRLIWLVSLQRGPHDTPRNEIIKFTTA